MAATALPPPITTGPTSITTPSAISTPALAPSSASTTEHEPGSVLLANEFLKLDKPSTFINPVVERILRHRIHTEALVDCFKEIAQIHDTFGKALIKTLAKYQVDDVDALGAFHKPHIAFRQTIEQVAQNACSLGPTLTPDCDKLREANNLDGWKNIRKLESRSVKAAKNFEEAAAKLEAGKAAGKPLSQRKLDKLRDRLDKEKKHWTTECQDIFKSVQHLDGQIAATTAQLLSKATTVQESHSRAVVEASTKLAQETVGLNHTAASQYLISIAGGTTPPSPLKPLKRSWGINRSSSISGASIVSPDGNPGLASLSRNSANPSSSTEPSTLSPIVDQDGFRVRPEDADRPPIPLKTGDSDDSLDATTNQTGKLKIQIATGAPASNPPTPGSALAAPSPPPPLPMRRPTQQSIGDNMGMPNQTQPSEPLPFQGVGATSWATNSAFNTLQPLQMQRTGGSMGMGAMSSTTASATFSRASANSSPFSLVGDVQAGTSSNMPPMFQFGTTTQQLYPSLAASPPPQQQFGANIPPLILMSPLATHPQPNSQAVPMFSPAPVRVKVVCQEQLKILCLDQQVLKLMVGGQFLLSQTVLSPVSVRMNNPHGLQIVDRNGSSQTSKSLDLSVSPSDPPQQLLLHYQGSITPFDIASLPVAVSPQVYHCDPATNEVIVSLTWRTSGDTTKVESLAINSVGVGVTFISNPHGAIPDSVTQSLVWHNPSPGVLTVRYRPAENVQQKLQGGLQVNVSLSTDRSLSGITAETMDCQTLSVAKLCVFRFTKVSPSMSSMSGS